MLEHFKKKINEKFINTEISKIKEGDLDLVMDHQEEISKKIAGAGRIRRFAELGKVMFGMIRDYRSGTYRSIPWFSVAATAMVLLYVFNPLDLVPDFVPGLGYIDDFLVYVAVIKLIESELHSYLDWKINESR